MERAGRKPKVFISHASVDLWVARTLAERAQLCGADAFLDHHEVEYGDDFEERIISEADEATELLVLLTPFSTERKYVWLELGMFLGSRKRIVAALYGVTIDEVANDKFTPVMLKRVSSVELNYIDKYFEQLKSRVEEWRGKNEGPRIEHTQ